MRFYLDNDVDHRCRKILMERGQECWATSEAGRSDASDDDQAVYADDKHAVVVTHDREFTERMKKNTTGRHVRLCGEQPDGPRLLERWIALVLPALEAMPYVVIELRQEGYQVFSAWK